MLPSVCLGNACRIVGLPLLSVLAAVITAAGETVLEEIHVDHIWSVHRSSPPILVTAGDFQYLAYYDANRRLTLAQRRLDSQDWRYERLPVVTQWATGGHALIGLAVDRNGHVHLVPYRRGLAEAPETTSSAIYYRTTLPHDLDSLTLTHMVAPDEPNPHYPVFIRAPDGRLYFEYRIGGSGSGSQRWNVYDRETRSWEVLPVFLDGRGRMSAYGGPRLGPDGRWHCLWMWRNTPAAETNHSLSYMVSEDLLNWETAAGDSVSLPVDPDERGVVVDPRVPGEGLINMVHRIGWDSLQRPVVAYHAYDPDGNSAIYNARFENGEWRLVPAIAWDFRWGFRGTGAIPAVATAGGVSPFEEGRLVQRVWSEQYGSQYLVLDEAALELVEIVDESRAPPVAAPPAWRAEHGLPEVQFPLRPMSVKWLPDMGDSGDSDVRYEVRWETGPVNRDRPLPEPWPDPTPLRVYKILHQ